MVLVRWSVIIFAGTLGTILTLGCQAKKQAATPSVPPPADTRALDMIRDDFARLDPGARVGLVIAVLPEERLAAVGQIQTREFREGEPMTFIDSAKNALVNGRIVAITPDSLHVKYEIPKAGERAPREGDLAVRIKPTP